MRPSPRTISATTVVLALLLLLCPASGHAEEFFDNQTKALTHIDNSLLEGMMTGHNGLLLKTAHFMDQGLQAKDAASKTVLNKIAWYNAVNAHRMLDSLLPAIQNPEMRKDMTKTLRFLDTGITLIGRRFGWNEATTKVMYGKTRSLIEARIEDLKQGPLAH
jgi:hypothetical protein